MSIALQNEVATLRARVDELTAQVTKLSAQHVVEQSKRTDITARLAQLEDALAGLVNKGVSHGDRQPRAKVRA